MDSQKFGTFIAQCRKDKKMTQSDLAAKLNVTDKAISRWERGVGFPDINTIEPLAAALDVSVAELMRDVYRDEQRNCEQYVKFCGEANSAGEKKCFLNYWMPYSCHNFHSISG